MINQKKKTLSLCTLTIPWVSALFIGRKSFIRFLPAAAFAVDVFALLSDAADKKRLWKVNNGLFPRLTLDVPYFYAKNNLGGDVVHAD